MNNGAADLLTVDILALRIQSALGRLLAATEALERWRTQAKKLAKGSWPEVETCLRILQDAESDLYVADRMATSLQPQPEDKGDRNLRQAMLIAASGGFPCFSDDLPKPQTKRRSRKRPQCGGLGRG